MRKSVLILVAPALLAACASTSGPNTYESDLRRLTDECRERGGILAPTGQQSGQAAADNVCKITGGPSPLTRPRD